MLFVIDVEAQKKKTIIHIITDGYKGTPLGNLPQYIQNKLHKWGYNFFSTLWTILNNLFVVYIGQNILFAISVSTVLEQVQKSLFCSAKQYLVSALLILSYTCTLSKNKVENSAFKEHQLLQKGVVKNKLVSVQFVIDYNQNFQIVFIIQNLI